MTYTLANLIEDLKKQNQDLPVILSQDEYPQCFKTLYVNQLHLQIADKDMQTVAQFLELSKMFPEKYKQIHLQKVIDNHLYRFYVSGIEEHYGSVYIVLEELDNDK